MTRDIRDILTDSDLVFMVTTLHRNFTSVSRFIITDYLQSVYGIDNYVTITDINDDIISKEVYRYDSLNKRIIRLKSHIPNEYLKGVDRLTSTNTLELSHILEIIGSIPKRYIEEILTFDRYIMYDILRDKFKTFVISKSLMMFKDEKISVKDVILFKNSFEKIYDDFLNFSNHNPKETAIYCRMISTQLGIDVNTLANISMYHNFDYAIDVKAYLGNIKDNEIPVSDVIANESFSDICNSNVVPCYKPSIDVMSDNIFFTDDELPEVKRELKTLVSGDICNFDNECKDISDVNYRIDSSDLACIKSKLNYDMALICVDGNKYYNAIMINHIPCLLYTLKTDNKYLVRAISIYEDENHERVTSKFFIPSEYVYKIHDNSQIV